MALAKNVYHYLIIAKENFLCTNCRRQAQRKSFPNLQDMSWGQTQPLAPIRCYPSSQSRLVWSRDFPALFHFDSLCLDSKTCRLSWPHCSSYEKKRKNMRGTFETVINLVSLLTNCSQAENGKLFSLITMLTVLFSLCRFV